MGKYVYIHVPVTQKESAATSHSDLLAVAAVLQPSLYKFSFSMYKRCIKRKERERETLFEKLTNYTPMQSSVSTNLNIPACYYTLQNFSRHKFSFIYFFIFFSFETTTRTQLEP